MKAQIQTRNGKVTRHAMKEIAPGHHRSKPMVEITYTAEVWVDFESVEYLTRKAALSKTGKAKSGPVTIKITKRTETPL